MLRKCLFALAVIATMAAAGASTVQARGCGRYYSRGYYSGGYGYRVGRPYGHYGYAPRARYHRYGPGFYGGSRYSSFYGGYGPGFYGFGPGYYGRGVGFAIGF